MQASFSYGMLPRKVRYKICAWPAAQPNGSPPRPRGVYGAFLTPEPV